MKIVFDNRETPLLNKCLQLSPSMEYGVEVLCLGDISIRNSDGCQCVLVERKSVDDLLASIKDGRYEEQSYRLLNACELHTHNIVYVIEGSFSNVRSPVDKKIAMSAMISLNLLKGFSVVRTYSLTETADYILALSSKLQKEMDKGKHLAFSKSYPQQSEKNASNSIHIGETISQLDSSNIGYTSVVKKVKKDNITPENIGEILLCQIPGISSVIACELIRVYGSFHNIMQVLQDESKLAELYALKLNSQGKLRKISRTVVDNLKRYLCISANTPTEPISCLDASPQLEEDE